MRIGIIGALLLVACAGATHGKFRDQPAVWQVADTRSISEPAKHEHETLGYYLDAYLVNRMRDAVDPRRGPARDINALDEVPDSTWFENRIGLRDVSIDALVRGAGLADAPRLPLTILSAKPAGNPGFVVEDALGVRYMLKFDTVKNPEQQTAFAVIANRLFWAIGYHVPSDHLVWFRRSDLRSHRVSDAAIDRILAAATRDGDLIRGSASAFVPGTPKGGWSATGVREDDPNDTIAHEHRRSLRGLRVFAAWLGHTDIRPDNTLDAFVEENGRRFLRHYLIDFGEALGGHQSEHEAKEIGFERGFDLAAQTKGLVTFGLWVREWEKQTPTPWPAIGYFSAAHFDPDAWRDRYPYEPFTRMTDADAYWAAKIVMRFTRAQLEAVVAQGRISDPDAASYLVDTLLERRRKIGHAYLDRVTPFDRLTIEDGRVCGVDLARAYQIETTGAIVVDGVVYEADASGRACFPVELDERYRIRKIAIRRADHTTPAMQLHYRGGVSPRILGVVR